MTLNTLKDVYLDQIQDLHSACVQALEITNELGRTAKNADLSKALIAGSNGISEGIEALKILCDKHHVGPNEKHCRGMEGLVAEARAHALETDFGSDDVRDAVIITQYQRMVHYALAGYGCLTAFANRLELDEDGAVLQKHLEANYSGDRSMTELATKGGINAEAA